jgi:hypothetical protein
MRYFSTVYQSQHKTVGQKNDFQRHSVLKSLSIIYRHFLNAAFVKKKADDLILIYFKLKLTHVI